MAQLPQVHVGRRMYWPAPSQNALSASRMESRDVLKEPAAAETTRPESA